MLSHWENIVYKGVSEGSEGEMVALRDSYKDFLKSQLLSHEKCLGTVTKVLSFLRIIGFMPHATEQEVND